MKPRTCFVRVWIATDAGAAYRYSVRSLPAAELSQVAVAGFRLVNLSRDPSPEYRVRLLDGGEAVCNCRQFDSAGACKHADALVAAGLLPSAILGVLRQRTKLLDEAEAELQQCRRNIDNLLETVKNLNERNAQLAERALQMQTALAAGPPARPRRSRPAKRQAA